MITACLARPGCSGRHPRRSGAWEHIATTGPAAPSPGASFSRRHSARPRHWSVMPAVGGLRLGPSAPAHRARGSAAPRWRSPASATAASRCSRRSPSTNLTSVAALCDVDLDAPHTQEARELFPVGAALPGPPDDARQGRRRTSTPSSSRRPTTRISRWPCTPWPRASTCTSRSRWRTRSARSICSSPWPSARAWSPRWATRATRGTTTSSSRRGPRPASSPT